MADGHRGKVSRLLSGGERGHLSMMGSSMWKRALTARVDSFHQHIIIFFLLFLIFYLNYFSLCLLAPFYFEIFFLFTCLAVFFVISFSLSFSCRCYCSTISFAYAMSVQIVSFHLSVNSNKLDTYTYIELNRRRAFFISFYIIVLFILFILFSLLFYCILIVLIFKLVSHSRRISNGFIFFKLPLIPTGFAAYFTKLTP